MFGIVLENVVSVQARCQNMVRNVVQLFFSFFLKTAVHDAKTQTLVAS